MITVFFFNYIIFKDKTMQWLKSPLQPIGHGFEHFLEFSFSFMNKMDKNKLHINNFFKLITQEQFHQKNHVLKGTMA